MRSTLAVLSLVVLAATGCSRRPAGEPAASAPLPIVPDIQARRAQFAPMALAADVASLPDSERAALAHLVAAARVMDELFVRQVWTGNAELAPRVAALAGPDGEAAREYYRIMAGPWDRLVEFEPFVGTTRHPAGAGFYPEDMGKAELETHLAANPAARAAFTSTTTVIRREGGRLVAIPYSTAYAEPLQRAATHLRAAATATTNPSLRRFCELRADALLSDDYFASDMAWMDLDSPIEIVIGPYETYEDGLFGYKAAFEAFVCVESSVDSQRLAVFKAELPYLEASLPIPDEHKNPNRGTQSPIRVADVVFTAGDAKAGVQTLAFNLPNDERVREARGSKNVMLKNIMHAKYNAILKPIAARVLPASDAGRLDFDAYYFSILLHELAHGLGPGRITKDGRETEVRLELKELYSALEEAKADVLGAYNLYLLADRGVVPQAVVEPLPWTFLAGLFRSARFGTTEAHGLGVVLQTTYLLEKGAVEVGSDGRFHPIPARFRDALRDLAHDLLMVQAEGSYEGAQRLVERNGAVPPAMRALLGSFGDIPVDVDPVFSYLERASE